MGGGRERLDLVRSLGLDVVPHAEGLGAARRVEEDPAPHHAILASPLPIVDPQGAPQILARLDAGLQRDIGVDALALEVVRESDDGGLGHVVVGDERALDLGGAEGDACLELAAHPERLGEPVPANAGSDIVDRSEGPGLRGLDEVRPAP